MISSRSSCLALLALVLLLAPSAVAQTQDGPVSGPPRSLGEDLSEPGSTGQTPAAAATPLGQTSGVVVSKLGTVDGPAVGLLDQTTGSLGASMWLNASRPRLEEELSRLPAATTDPFMRGLARRILLTPAEAPVGSATHALITIRLNKLIDAGYIDEAGALASIAALPNNEEFQLAQARALLFAGRDQDVCSDKTATRLSSADPFWLQLRTYCYLANGDTAAADLTRSVMAAKGDDDALFDDLIDDVQNAKADAPSAMALHPTAVDIFLLRKLDLPVTARIAANLGTAANLLALRDSRNSPADRLICAERILGTGALTPADLKAIAAVQPADPSAMTQNARDGGPSFLAHQILIKREAELESRPPAKLALIAGAEPLGRGMGDEFVFAALDSDVVASIPAQPDAGDAALTAARVLILTKNFDSAAAWVDAPNSSAAAQAAIALDVSMRTADRDAKAAGALGWFSAHADAVGSASASAMLAFGIWSALGRTLPPDVQAGQTAPQTQDLSPDTSGHLAEAAGDPERRGEAALLVLDAIGEKGVAALAPGTSVRLVAALERAGLDGDARALAREVLLLYVAPPPAALSVPQPQ